MKKLEAVTTCFQYSDLLAETAVVNLQHFDRWVIVTEPSDEGTRELCRRLCLPCILTEETRRDGDPFNKGRAIQRGLDNLSLSGAVLHLDADIALPARFRQMLDLADLDISAVYGFDRLNIRSWEQWRKLRDGGLLIDQYAYHYAVKFHEGLDVGARWVSPIHGYVPIGAAQLFFGQEVQWRGVWSKPYVAHHASAARSDIQFGLQWDRRKRVLVPEILVYHLDVGRPALGANWRGRTTPPFGPVDPQRRTPFGAQGGPSID